VVDGLPGRKNAKKKRDSLWCWLDIGEKENGWGMRMVSARSKGDSESAKKPLETDVFFVGCCAGASTIKHTHASPVRLFRHPDEKTRDGWGYVDGDFQREWV